MCSVKRISLFLRIFKNKKAFWYALVSKGFLCWLPDGIFVRVAYYVNFGSVLRLNEPLSFNEKLQWLKLHDRKSEYTMMVDKYVVKDYVSKIIGNQYVVPNFGVWNSFDEIDFSSLPNQFVLKCTHDSGGLVICKDKSKFDYAVAKIRIERCLKKNYFYSGREWPYKNVRPRIIAEQYMEDSQIKELRDYKFFVFNGRVKCFKIDFDRFKGHRANYYDVNGRILPFGESICPPDFNKKILMPKNLRKMISLAETLSKGIMFVRIDFYEIDGKIYFGEVTFYPASGFGSFVPSKWDMILGSWLSLRK